MKLPDPPLLVITDRRQARHPLDEVAAALFAGGCRWLSLREKDLPPAERLALLDRLVALARPWDALVSMHDDIDGARAAGVRAVHLPDGGDPGAARSALGAAALIGISAHDEAGLARAAAAGADYATLSPILASDSKPGYGPALGFARLAAAVRSAAVPVLALGGIDETAVSPAIAAGAAGVAVMGAAMAAPDPQAAAAALVARLRAALAGSNFGPHSASA